MFMLACLVVMGLFSGRGVMHHLITSAVAQQVQVPVDISMIRRSSGMVRKGYQAGAVTINPIAKEVRIEWESSALQNSLPTFPLPYDPATNSLGGNKARSSNQTVSTRFHPTAVAVSDRVNILVVGINDQDKTVMELWTLGWPAQMPAPMTSMQTGITDVAIVHPTVSANRFYAQPSGPGLRYVRNVCAMRRPSGAATHAVVQFHDSGDLHIVSFATGTLSLLGSSTNGSGTLGLISSLSPSDQYVAKFGDRNGTGFVYMFVRGLSPSIGNAATPPTLVLIDADRNGAIESYVNVSYPDWMPQGWGSLSNYNNWWLE